MELAAQLVEAFKQNALLAVLGVLAFGWLALGQAGLTARVEGLHDRLDDLVGKKGGRRGGKK